MSEKISQTRTSQQEIIYLRKQNEDLKTKCKEYVDVMKGLLAEVENYRNNEEIKKIKQENEDLKKELTLTKESWMSDVNKRIEEKGELEKKNNELQEVIYCLSRKIEEEKEMAEVVDKMKVLYKNYVDVIYALNPTYKEVTGNQMRVSLGSTELSVSEIKKKEDTAYSDVPLVNDTTYLKSDNLTYEQASFYPNETRRKEEKEISPIKNGIINGAMEEDYGEFKSTQENEQKEVETKKPIVKCDAEMKRTLSKKKSIITVQPLDFLEKKENVQLTYVSEAFPMKTEKKKHNVVCFTGIKENSKPKYVSALQRKGGVYSNYLDENVTHLVAHKKITKSCLVALLRGIWIMPIDWLTTKGDNFQEENTFTTKKESGLKGKKIYFSRIFEVKKVNCEIKDVIVEEGNVIVVNEMSKCDIALVDEKENKPIEFKEKIFTVHEFLRKLPFPPFVCFVCLEPVYKN